MSIELHSPVNLGLIRALDRLGLKGTTIPEVLEGIRPVLVVGDIHDSIASELVEARKTATARLPAAASIPVMYLESRSAGGLVMEQLLCGTGFQAGEEIPVVLAVLGPRTIAAAPAVTVQGEVGGVPCFSSLHAAGYALPPPFAGSQLFGVRCPNFVNPATFWGESPARIYVGPGEALHFYALVNAVLTISVTWRELADIQGGS